MNIFKNILVAGITGVITLLSGVCVGLPSCYLFTNPTQIKIKDMEANTEEVWKDIKGYEGLYQVSNRGRIRSLNRVIIRNNNSLLPLKGKILKNKLNGKGYSMITLSKDNKKKNFTIHRLVANAFLSNPHNKKDINHKDGNKLNNVLENLEYATRSENMIHAYKNELWTPPWLNKFGKNHFASRPVIQFDKKGEFINRYESLQEVQRKIKISTGNVWLVCNGKRPFAGGFIWKYADDVNNKNIKYAT